MKALQYFNSPIGLLRIEASDIGITKLVKVGAVEESESHSNVTRLCVKQLEEYFKSERQNFTFPIDLSTGNAFQKSVWEELCKIPYGQTRSYGFVAEAIGMPSASRAVGKANSQNPIAIAVPCHRVIGKSGDLTGYFYGLDVKRKLLALENPKSFAEQGSLF